MFSDVKNSIIAVLVVVIVISLGVLSYQRSVISSLEKDKEELIGIKYTLEQKALENDKKLKEYSEVEPLIVTKYTTIYKEIENSKLSDKDKVFNYVKRMRDEALNTSTK